MRTAPGRRAAGCGNNHKVQAQAREGRTHPEGDTPRVSQALARNDPGNASLRDDIGNLAFCGTLSRQARLFATHAVSFDFPLALDDGRLVPEAQQGRTATLKQINRAPPRLRTNLTH